VVAELLRLRLRLVANSFRRGSGPVAGRVLGLLVAVVLVVAAFIGVRMLAGSGAQFTARAIVGVGAFASLAALLVPFIVARRELMPARAFLGTPVRRRVLIPVLAVLTLLGPAVLTVPAVLAPAVAWHGVAAAVAVGCGLMLVVQTLLSLRIGAAAGSALRSRRRLSGWLRALAVLLLVLAAVPAVATILTRILLLIPDRIAPGVRITLGLLRPIEGSPAIDLLAGSPLGALWAAPAFADLGEGGRAGAAVLTGAAAIVVLGVAWIVIARLELRPTWRRREAGATRRVPGWFGRTPSTPVGAIAARSFSYWIRDPRYRTVFAILPVIPVLMLVALAIGGVPFSIGVLVPLPVMVLVLAWSTVHNDVAYDHTAIWQHLAADVRGRDDRIGRMLPPLVFGALLVLVGSVLTAWGHGDAAILPAVLGVNAAVLLGSVGVGSGLSARFPYTAPRPGDGAFRHPQGTGATGGAAQGLSIVLIALTALPALAAAGLCLAGAPGPWNWVALVAGLVVGSAVLVLGTVGGARAYDRRGPELLAFTMRN